MIFLKLQPKKLERTWARSYVTNLSYNIPSRYRNSFFLANAPLFNYTNWFIHRAYEVCFADLVEKLIKNEPLFGDLQAGKKVVKIINCLEPCNNLVDINFPIRRSDGFYEIVRGFRAHHGVYIDDTPFLGGMRICADLTRDHVKSLSVLSTFRYACMDIQMTGAHGGIKISGEKYDDDELKTVVEAYGKELTRRGIISGHVDIIEPDLYCGSQEMAWISDEFTKNIDETKNNLMAAACAVGKPSSSGGIKNYDKSLAEGVHYTLSLFINNKNILDQVELECGIKGKTFIVQGLGKIGSQIAILLENAGATCVGVKEYDAYIYDEQGFCVKDLVDYKNEKGTIEEFSSKVKPKIDNTIFAQACDILILAATHRSLQCYIAEKVQAKIIVEAAYAPMTPTANKILLGKNKLVLPDIFAGSGASVTSYLEYVKNLQCAPYNVLHNRFANTLLVKDDIKSMLMKDDDDIIVKNMVENFLRKSYEEILLVLDKFKLGLDVRTAAYINGIDKIFQKIYDLKTY